MSELYEVNSHENLIKMLEISRKRFADRPLFGTKRDGIYEWTTYEEFSQKVDAFRGLNVTLTTSARTDEEAEALLREFRFPLRT